MLNIKRALKQDRLLRALTGLNLQAFEVLLPAFTLIYEEQQALKPRCQRDIGGGRKAKLLSPQEKLFFILFYFKCYPTFDLAGILFDLDRSQTNRWMHRLQPILEEVLNQKMVLPLGRIRDVEEFTEHFPEVQAPHGGQHGRWVSSPSLIAMLMLTACGLWNFYLVAA